MKVYDVFHKKTNKNLNILFFESSSGCSGSANALVNVVKYLDKRRFNPIIAVKNYGSQIDKIKEAEIIKLKDYREAQKLSNFGFALYFIKSIIPEIMRLYFVIKIKRITLAHINTNIMLGLPVIIAAKIAGIPCVCHIRETRRLIRRERFLAKWVGRFILLNKDAYEVYKEDIAEEKLEIIYDGLDLDDFNQVRRGVLKNEYNLNSAPIVGTAGRIVEGKGQREFVLAVKAILKDNSKIKFAVVGGPQASDGDYYRQVKELAEKEELARDIIFTGWRNDIKAIVSDLDIFVFTSTTYPEGLPNTILEAMALRKPVVATDIPGPRDIVVDGETGFLVPAGNIKAMAEKIVYLLDQRDIAREMAEAGRKRAEELFDIKKQVKKIEKIYEDTLCH